MNYQVLRKMKHGFEELKSGGISNGGSEEIVGLKGMHSGGKGPEDKLLCSEILPGAYSASIHLSWTHNAH